MSLVYAAIGGALIGISATIMLLFIGRIVGISGILTQAVLGVGRSVKDISQAGSEISAEVWRILFLVGMVVGAWLAHAVFGAPMPTAEDKGYVLAIAAGLIVGVGTGFGSGCTSGHGICGLSRFSIRSLAATLVFMASGILTVLIVRHFL